VIGKARNGAPTTLCMCEVTNSGGRNSFRACDIESGGYLSVPLWHLREGILRITQIGMPIVVVSAIIAPGLRDPSANCFIKICTYRPPAIANPHLLKAPIVPLDLTSFRTLVELIASNSWRWPKVLMAKITMLEVFQTCEGKKKIDAPSIAYSRSSNKV
jgi:hypothetical protein